MTHDPTRHTVICEIDGKTYQGNYWVAGKILVVSTAKDGKSTQLGPHVPEALAQRLLRQLTEQGRA
jgi:hypothetical protein